MNTNKNTIDQLLVLLEYFHKKYIKKVCSKIGTKNHTIHLLEDLIISLTDDSWVFTKETNFELYHTDVDYEHKNIYLSKPMYITLEKYTNLQGKSIKNDPIPALEKKEQS